MPIMLKCRLLRPKIALTILGLEVFPDFDQVDCEKYKKEYQEKMSSLSGLDRVKEAFRSSDGIQTAEMSIITDTLSLSCFLSLMIGGVPAAKKEYYAYLESNKATIYHNIKHARKSLADKLVLATMKGSAKVAWRMGLFSVVFLGSGLAMQAYMNRHSSLAYCLSGILTGSLHQVRYGFRPLLFGAFNGCLVGGLSGVSIQIMYWATGLTFDDIRYARYVMDKAVESRQVELYRKERSAKDDLIQSEALSLLSEKKKEVEDIIKLETMKVKNEVQIPEASSSTPPDSPKS